LNINQIKIYKIQKNTAHLILVTAHNFSPCLLQRLQLNIIIISFRLIGDKLITILKYQDQFTNINSEQFIF
jgi:hypothetical protein